MAVSLSQYCEGYHLNTDTKHYRLKIQIQKSSGIINPLKEYLFSNSGHHDLCSEKEMFV